MKSRGSPNLKIAARHKKKAFFSAVTMMIAVLIASHLFPQHYNGVVKFPHAVPTESSGFSFIDDKLHHLREAIRQKLTGRPAIEQLVDDLQRTGDLPRTPDGELGKQNLVNRIKAKISVRQLGTPEHVDQIVVSYRDVDEGLVPKILNRLIKNYIRNTQQELDELWLEAKGFLDVEVARHQAKVTELESQILEFDHALTNVNTKLVEMRAKSDRIAGTLAVLKQKRDELIAWVKNQPEYHEKKRRGQNPLLARLLERRMRLEDDLEQQIFEKSRTEQHPAVIQQRNRIDEVDAQIANIDKEIDLWTEMEPNHERLNAERQVKSMGAEVVARARQHDKLNDQIEQYQYLERDSFVRRHKHAKLKRDLEEAASHLKFWETRRRQASLTLRDELPHHGARLSSAHETSEVMRPDKATMKGIFSAALVLGLATGVATMMFATRLDHSLHEVGQAADQLELPVLGAVNQITTPAQAKRRRVVSWAVFPVLGVSMITVLTVCVVITYMSFGHPNRYKVLFNDPGEFVGQALFDQS